MRKRDEPQTEHTTSSRATGEPLVPAVRTSVSSTHENHASQAELESLLLSFQLPTHEQEPILQIHQPVLPPRKPRRGALITSGLVVLVVASLLLVPRLLAPLPGPLLSTTPIGTVAFLSSGYLDPQSRTGVNDLVTVNLHGLPPPAAGQQYEAWLLPDQQSDPQPPRLLGPLSPKQGKAHLLYQDLTHQDLLVHYSGFCLTATPLGKQSPAPSPDRAACRAFGWLPQIPTPGDEMGYSFLSHLRHLLALDPTITDLGLAGGLLTWLARNSEKLLEYSTSARDSWAGAQTTADAAGLMHRQIIRILDYLDGQAYAWMELPQGTPWLIDPRAGHIGLLEVMVNQQPPGYLSHVALHLLGLANAPGHTEVQRRLAQEIGQALTQVTAALKELHEVAHQLVTLSLAQWQHPQTLEQLNTLVIQATRAYEGPVDPQIGNTTKGIIGMVSQIQQFATISVVSGRQATNLREGP
jgi:hypothetical protein